jgi:hypothetical protein
MKLWMSGEIQANAADAYRQARKDVENVINDKLSRSDYGSGIQKWIYIAIIREEDSEDYGEIKKYTRRTKEVEFRLKIEHSKFTTAHSTEQKRLLFESLLRSIREMKELRIPDVDFQRLETDVMSIAELRA